MELIITNEGLLRILKNQSLEHLIAQIVAVSELQIKLASLRRVPYFIFIYVKIHLEPLTDFLSKLAHNLQK